MSFREVEIKCLIKDQSIYDSCLNLMTFKRSTTQHNWYYSHSAIDNLSVRTRSNNPFSDKCKLIQKFGNNPINGQDRIELEFNIGIGQEDIDIQLKQQGFVIESKWYRKRYSYLSKYENFKVDDAINSGFGRIVELEAIGDTTLKDLYSYANALGLEVISIEAMDKAYRMVSSDTETYYNSFINEQPKYIDWTQCL